VGSALKVIATLSAVDLKHAAAAESHPKIRERILIVRYILAGNSIPQAGAAFSLKERQIRVWVHRFNCEGLAGLRDRIKPGQPVRIKPERIAAFKARIEAGAQPSDGVCVLRGKDIQRILRDEFQAIYSLDGVYALLHRLGFSSLVPRPRHPKMNPEAQAEFKKTSAPVWKHASVLIRTSASKSGSKTKRVSASKAR
jgi:transposase